MDVIQTGPAAPFYEQMELWLHSQDYSDNTVTLYRIGATRWVAYARPWRAGWPVRSIEWRKTLNDKAVKTQASFVGSAKLFLNWLIEEGILKGRNPLDTVKFRGMSTDYTHRRALTNDEVKALFATCDADTLIGLRDLAILKVMLYTALRIGAISRFLIEDIEDRGDVVVVRYQGKGQQSKARFKVLPSGVVDTIEAYLRSTGRSFEDKGPIWANAGGKPLSVHGIRKSVVRKLVECGIKDKSVTTHSLRHTAATRAIDSGNDIKAVQDLLDHGSIATTDRYIHSARQMERAAGLNINYDLEDEDVRRKRKGKGSEDGGKPNRANRKHADQAAGRPARRAHAAARDDVASKRSKHRRRSG